MGVYDCPSMPTRRIGNNRRNRRNDYQDCKTWHLNSFSSSVPGRHGVHWKHQKRLKCHCYRTHIHQGNSGKLGINPFFIYEEIGVNLLICKCASVIAESITYIANVPFGSVGLLWLKGVTVSMLQWYPGTQVPRYPGTQVPRYPGTQVPRYPGTQVPRYQVPRYPGTQVPRYPGTHLNPMYFRVLYSCLGTIGEYPGYQCSAQTNNSLQPKF